MQCAATVSVGTQLASCFVPNAPATGERRVPSRTPSPGTLCTTIRWQSLWKFVGYSICHCWCIACLSLPCLGGPTNGATDAPLGAVGPTGGGQWEAIGRAKISPSKGIDNLRTSRSTRARPVGTHSPGCQATIRPKVSGGGQRVIETKMWPTHRPKAHIAQKKGQNRAGPWHFWRSRHLAETLPSTPPPFQYQFVEGVVRVRVDGAKCFKTGGCASHRLMWQRAKTSEAPQRKTAEAPFFFKSGVVAASGGVKILLYDSTVVQLF